MKVLMVCLGNICRSPVADGLMRQHAADAGINMVVDSCGTASYHIGEAPDLRSQASCTRQGLDISFLRARHFKKSDLTEFDHILCMDIQNMKDVMKHADTDAEREKISLFLEAAFPGKNAAVPDPYTGSEDGFNDVFKLVDQGCAAWIKKWQGA